MEDSQRLLRLRNNAQGLSQRMYEQEHPTNMLGDVVSANLKEYINRKSKDGNFIITITNIDSGVFVLRIQSEADGKLLGKVSTDRGNSQKQKEEIVREYWYTGVRKLDSSSIRNYGEIYTLFDVKEDKEGKGVVFEVSYTFTLRKDNAPDNKVKDITNYIIKNCTKRLE